MIKQNQSLLSELSHLSIMILQTQYEEKKIETQRHTFLYLECLMLCMYVCVCIYVYLVARYNEKKVDINGERLREENSETD